MEPHRNRPSQSSLLGACTGVNSFLVSGWLPDFVSAGLPPSSYSCYLCPEPEYAVGKAAFCLLCIQAGFISSQFEKKKIWVVGAGGNFSCPSFDSTVISAMCAFGGKVLEDVEGRRMEGWRDAQRQEQPGEECRQKSGRRGGFVFYSRVGGESSELSRLELKGLNAAD